MKSVKKFLTGLTPSVPMRLVEQKKKGAIQLHACMRINSSSKQQQTQQTQQIQQQQKQQTDRTSDRKLFFRLSIAFAITSKNFSSTHDTSNTMQ